jgi:hypothetical protein
MTILRSLFVYENGAGPRTLHISGRRDRLGDTPPGGAMAHWWHSWRQQSTVTGGSRQSGGSI